jgi:DNA-binding response OmpR family regulator
MRILILEDDSTRVSNFIELLHKHILDITENAYDAIDYLDQYNYDLILLDHDLGEGNGSGSLVAAYLAQMNWYNPTIIIHSWNIAASNAMIGYLPNAYQAPYNTESFYDLIHMID